MFSYLLLATFVAFASANPTILSSRIYGGKSVSIEQYPYQVSLEYLGDHNCGGSIISSNYVLTAAHCVENYLPQDLGVRTGSSHILEGGTLYEVDKTFVHEEYRFTEYGVPLFDVALVHVKKPFEFGKTVKAVKLLANNKQVAPGSKAVVTGWGLTEKSPFLSKQLQAVEIPVHSREYCDEAYKSFEGIPMGQICAGDNGRGVCSADSGGPLVVDGYQIGIVSWSSSVCAHPKFPGVYMEVSSLGDWITKYAEL